MQPPAHHGRQRLLGGLRRLRGPRGPPPVRAAAAVFLLVFLPLAGAWPPTVVFGLEPPRQRRVGVLCTGRGENAGDNALSK